MKRIGVLVAAVAMSLCASCAGEPSVLTDAERAEIAQEVRSAAEAFAGSQRRLDVEAAVAFLAPEFTMLLDGQRLGYEAVVAQLRSSFPTLERFETTWSDVEVTMLGRDHALVTMTFRDVMTGKDGSIRRGRGPTTFVWRYVDGEWRILYVDADHYPDPADESR